MQVVRPATEEVYTGITQAVSRMSSSEGPSSMWRGLTSVILGAGIHNSPPFLVREHGMMFRPRTCSVFFNL